MTRWQLTVLSMASMVAGIVGCKSFFAPRGMPDDPLLLSRPPIESKGQIVPPPPLVHREPVPPSLRVRNE